MSEVYRTTNVMIGSLNCRSLSTPTDITRRQFFTNFLRHQSLDILTLQETHASTNELQHSLNMLLQSQSGCWSTHCGIVSLNKNVIVHPVLSSIDQRFLLVSVEHVNSLFDTFHILTIYAPSNAPDRRTF